MAAEAHGEAAGPVQGFGGGHGAGGRGGPASMRSQGRCPGHAGAWACPAPAGALWAAEAA